MLGESKSRGTGRLVADKAGGDKVAKVLGVLVRREPGIKRRVCFANEVHVFEQLVGRGRRVGVCSDGRLDENDSERPDVCGVVVPGDGAQGVDPLWGHVCDGSDKGVAVCKGGLDLLGDAKVCDLDDPVRGEEDVLWLDVSVDEVLFCVEVDEAVEDLLGEASNDLDLLCSDGRRDGGDVV